MATTNSGFVKYTAAQLVGSSSVAAGAVVALNGSNAVEVVAGGAAVRLDQWVTDLSLAGFALNGAASYTLSGTTAVNIDLTNLATGAASNAGDPTFAKFMQLICYNSGAADVTIASGASNPASLGFAGTTPTLTVPAGKTFILNFATAGVTVDSTHKILTVTPTAGGSFALCVGGA